MVLLEEINNANCKEVKKIQLLENQEKYLPKEFICLSDANENHDQYESYLVYKDAQPIGFVLLQVDKKNEHFNILFVAIDKYYEGESYLREALTVSVNYLISQGASEVGAYYPQGNEELEKIYRSIGFKKTSLVKEGKVYLTYSN